MLSTDRSSHVLAHRRPLYPISGNAAYTMNGAVNGAISYPPQIEHIWIITGPAGCGKTTVAKYLAKELSLPYVEGDDVWSPLTRVASNELTTR
jgi:gluconokinase